METKESKGNKLHTFVRLHKLNVKKMRLPALLTIVPKQPMVTKQTSLPYSVAWPISRKSCVIWRSPSRSMSAGHYLHYLVRARLIMNRVTDDNSSVLEDLDDIEPLGSTSTVKIIPFMSPKKINLAASEPGIKKHAIVAQYELPPSWKGDMTKLGVSDVKGPPLNTTINSSEILTLLKTVSGTSLRVEPCV